MRKNNSGFTLIEVIVYLAIVSVFLVAVVGFGDRIISAYTKAKNIQDVQQGARFSLERLAQDMRSSQSVDFTDGVLHLAGADIDYQVEGGQLTRKAGPTGSATAITSSDIEVQNFTVSALENTVVPTCYRVELSLKYKNDNNLPEYDWQQNFTTTINIRHGN